ncbi:MRX complex DNA-binding subunit KNAG_0F00650 [Huiozyma naganishii CBS 8797]|uniref:DNA repair protein RAD50 n=1 Tax=Huiozyma naganishii (strain ATCC MYA-139 / BCRC 22969 / CBS 8797 / KCTC 17520 / NBRC 10181 / NCYC 3082 / Yp74L-3) TaxID=1071383 RepID=J7S727_HUIN7|nr:hypothetical protein KNAG_0F00650 [Kazachstania naganishii CBS 8797]CCK70734.1 hypothetical protein KNAG_0F00650 [Kazachstania naganishii CBS 8797]
MSAIHKLSIQGIRSFDSNDRETIEFGAPLTLIVGMNGSGKTTVIECLKYATTGTLPPNSKGGVFVHDPKITGEKDVRAQVKLAFSSANGLNMIVTRNIQLLAKKTTNTFKTLEGQLVAINQSGERTTLSTKSMELDTQVPLYMGVPSAILDYVIFCHQEDSLWPLSEPSNLKKKFDEIFQAMKFTKAIDNLKVIKKDMAVEIKLLQQSVEHLKIDRDRSKTTKIKIQQLEAKIEQFRQQVKNIESQILDITGQSDRLFKSNQTFQEVLSKVENLKTLKLATSNEIERLSATIELLDLPKDELSSLLDNFSLTLQQQESKLDQTQYEINQLKNQLQNAYIEKDDLIRKEAELTSKRHDYEQLKHDRLTLIEEFKQKFPLDLSSDYPTECLRLLRDYKKTLESDAQMVKAEGESKLAKIENHVAEQVYEETVQNQKLEYCIRDKTDLKKRIDWLETELKSSDVSEETLEDEKKALTELNGQLANFEKGNASEEVIKLLKLKNMDILSAEEELEKIQEQILKTNQQTDLFAKLGLIKKSIEEKKGTVTDLEETLQKNDISQILPTPLNNEDLDLEFKKFYISLQKDIALSNIVLHDKENKLSEITFRLDSSNADIERNKAEIQALTLRLDAELPEDCPIDEYDEVVADAELSYKTALENLKMHQTTLEFNRKALDIAQNKDCCYLCSRKFENVEVKSRLLAELKKKTDANFEHTLVTAVNEEKEFLHNLRTMEKDIISLRNIKEQVKKLEELKPCLVEEHTSTKASLEEIENSNRKLKEKREVCEKTLRRTIEQIVDNSKELNLLEAEFKGLSKQLEMYNNSSGTLQTVDELRAEQKQKNDLLRKLRKDINDLQEERERKTKEHNSLINMVKEKTLSIREMESSVASEKNIQREYSAKKTELNDIEHHIQSIKSEIEKTKGEKEKKQSQYNRQKLGLKLLTEKSQTDIINITKACDKLGGILDKVRQYEQQDFNALEKCQDTIKQADSTLKNIEKQLNEKTEYLYMGRQKLQDSNNEKRNLRDNIELLNLKDKLQSIIDNIKRLDVRNAETEREKYQQESEKLRNLYEGLSAENAGKLGEMKQLQNQIDSLSLQLGSDYKDVDQKYQKEWVELQARTFVTDDIDTYSKALDNAIMKYHGLKMEDINRIIDELWKRTYSGTDIDTIKIRSEEVNNTVRGKSYNYRVVMFKQDAELDMRGRCSAGQKVLASIIIRLALSETFGLNCGVIALDEPTTNLDEENIESLAQSLHNIIQMRKYQKNFQLIVITHDEKFLMHMNAGQFTDHFFKIKRDDRQKSQIEWVDINRVTEY